MIFKNILPDRPIEEIEVRTLYPDGEDRFLGFCAWNTRDLISLDGDTYERCWLIEDYDYTIDGMVVWIKPTWGNDDIFDDCWRYIS